MYVPGSAGLHSLDVRLAGVRPCPPSVLVITPFSGAVVSSRVTLFVHWLSLWPYIPMWRRSSNRYPASCLGISMTEFSVVLPKVLGSVLEEDGPAQGRHLTELNPFSTFPRVPPHPTPSPPIVPSLEGDSSS